MAFHVACPITCRRICNCSLGFSRDLRRPNGEDEFLKKVNQVEEFRKDPRVSSNGGTVQVRVPKVVPAPQKTVSILGVGDGVGVGVGVGVVDELAEEASAQKKRVSLQRQAAVTVEAAEDYARRFESGVNELSSRDLAGEEVAHSGMNIMCRMCFLGEGEGSDKAKRMLSCKHCGKKYHKNCLKSWAQHRDLFHWSSWSCPSCRVCEVCRRTGDPNKFMFCKRCDAAYHCYCQHPPHKNVSSGPYLCPKHTRCHSCDSTVPGNGLSVRWFLSYTCCDACGRLFVKGNYCPVCLKVYRDSESTPMVCCDICQRWVHCHCDGISEAKYQQFQVDGKLQYKCATCRGECYQVKDPQDAIQELWKKKDVVDKDLIASLRAAAGLPTEEEIFSISPISDDEENGPVSGRSLKFSIKGLVEKSPKKSKEYGKNSSKKHASKKGSHTKLESEVHQEIKSERRRLGGARIDNVGFQINEQSDVNSSVAGICSTHEPKIVKHKRVDDVMVTDEEKPSRIVRIKCSKPHDSDSEDTLRNAREEKSVKTKKLVINLGARKLNVSGSSKSNVVSHLSRDKDQSALGGDKIDQTGEVRTLKISGRFGKTQSEGSKATFGSITQFPASTSEGNHVDDKTSISPSLQKEARPLLKFKLRKPNSGAQTSLVTTQSEDEKLSPAKGQRSKRKRPASLVEMASMEEDNEATTPSYQDSSRNDELMDANWILKKLGKDSIGKRVEVHGSQNSWHKGTVTDVSGDTSTLSVSLDDGSIKTFELGKHSVRFIPQKQKRSRS
ncbi:PREDICTED: histone-lysine N-methyltransferase 2C [Camelina sativa]|uniref:Histone-lysine N-methyltransferase 2C n=1 Tax=Camelina sativa TaxID=90675 RepID=A0ABM0W1Q2_CAMSA|nr:PREDICTED: histone-lysine N-methyltransferase 2C [Camelina sativa]